MTDDQSEGTQTGTGASHDHGGGANLPESARCSRCGKAQLALLRTFATGTGGAYRTLSDDVYCLHCGLIGQPVYELSDTELSSTGTEIGRRSLKRMETGA